MRYTIRDPGYHEEPRSFRLRARQKALERREQDPDGAITSAWTLLEEVCRFVLDSEGETYDEKADLPNPRSQDSCSLS
jgi:hypothetical protein